MEEKMKKNKNIPFAVAILVILVIAALMVVYIVFIWDKDSKENVTETIHPTSDYVTVVDVDYSNYLDAFASLDIKKIALKNVDESIISEFTTKQLELLSYVDNNYEFLINSIENIDNYEKISSMESVTSYLIANNILSIYYELTENIDYKEGNNSYILTYNIDLENNKVLSYDEMLYNYNINKTNVATSLFEHFFNEEYNSENLIDAVSLEMITKEKVVNNRSEYIERIENELENITSLYISDNELFIAYREENVEMLCFSVNKSGPFGYLNLSLATK